MAAKYLVQSLETPCPPGHGMHVCNISPWLSGTIVQEQLLDRKQLAHLPCLQGILILRPAAQFPRISSGHPCQSASPATANASCTSLLCAQAACS